MSVREGREGEGGMVDEGGREEACWGLEEREGKLSSRRNRRETRFDRAVPLSLLLFWHPFFFEPAVKSEVEA